MNPDFLKLSELIPNEPWAQFDIGMIADCVAIQCMYCGCNKGNSGKTTHFSHCPWPELSSLAKQMRKEFKLKYGTLAKIQNERCKRRFKMVKR